MFRIFLTPVPYGVLAVLLSTAIAVIEAKQKHWARAATAITSGLLSALVATWAALDRASFESDLRARTDILRKQGAQNVALTQEVSNLVTGGDSFVYLRFESDGRVSVEHVGKYPVYDIEIDIVDVDKFQRHPGTDFQEQLHSALVSRTAKQILLNVITAKAKTSLVDFPFSSEPFSRFKVLIATRNGQFAEYVMLRKSEQKLRSACRVFEIDPDGKIMREMIPAVVETGFLETGENVPDWSWIQ